MALELVPLCTVALDLKPPTLLGVTPTGARMIVEVNDIVATGERLRGRMHGNAAADWITVSPDSTVGTLDVRFTLETDDEALVFVQYRGRMDYRRFPPVIYAAPLFETGDERYSWLNYVQGAAIGQVSDDLTRLDYEVFELR